MKIASAITILYTALLSHTFGAAREVAPPMRLNPNTWRLPEKMAAWVLGNHPKAFDVSSPDPATLDARMRAWGNKQDMFVANISILRLRNNENKLRFAMVCAQMLETEAHRLSAECVLQEMRFKGFCERKSILIARAVQKLHYAILQESVCHRLLPEIRPFVHYEAEAAIRPDAEARYGECLALTLDVFDICHQIFPPSDIPYTRGYVMKFACKNLEGLVAAQRTPSSRDRWEALAGLQRQLHLVLQSREREGGLSLIKPRVLWWCSTSGFCRGLNALTRLDDRPGQASRSLEEYQTAYRRWSFSISIDNRVLARIGTRI